MSKYFSHKVEIEGITFDSKKEGEYYLKLKQMEKDGLIRDLELQKEYTLQDKFKLGKKTVRKITYKADFTYISNEDDKLHVIDIKSKYTAKDKVFCIKKKMFAYRYGMEIEVII